MPHLPPPPTRLGLGTRLRGQWASRGHQDPRMALLGSQGGRRQAAEGRSPGKRGKGGGGGSNVLIKWESPWQETLLPSPRPLPPWISPTEWCLEGRHGTQLSTSAAAEQ